MDVNSRGHLHVFKSLPLYNTWMSGYEHIHYTNVVFGQRAIFSVISIKN